MNKVIIITGVNRGLGKAIADVFLKDNDNSIISISRSLNDAHMKISEDKFIFVKTDLSQPFSNSIIDIIQGKVSDNSEILFFNNASIILPIDKIGNFKEDQIEKSINVNIQYPVNLVNSLIDTFPSNKITIVNITSGAGINPISYWSLYGASKAYMKLFFRILEEENMDNENLIVYNIDPGVLDTGMQENIRGNNFPKQDYFKSLKEEDKLITPELAALNIINEIKQ